MKVLSLSLFAISTAILITSCQNQGRADDELMDLMDDYSYEEPEPVDLTPVEADWNTLISKDLQDGQNVIFEGYVGQLPMTMYNYDNREITLDFYERRNQTEGPKMRVDVTIGTSPGHVRSLPEDYKQSDLRIICEGGKTASVGTHVRVEGSYSNSTADYYNYADLTKITILDETFDETVLENAIELTNEVIEDSTLDDTYTYVDATLETSMYMSSYDGKYTISVNQSNNDYLERAYVYIGTSAGEMEQLHDDFTDKDFIIYDYKGDAQKAGSGKYRLYGTFNPLNVESKGVFTVEEIKKL